MAVLTLSMETAKHKFELQAAAKYKPIALSQGGKEANLRATIPLKVTDWSTLKRGNFSFYALLRALRATGC